MITIRPLLFGLVLLAACSTQSVIESSREFSERGDYRNAFKILDEARQDQMRNGGTVSAQLEAAHHQAWLEWLLVRARQHIFAEQEDKALDDLATLMEADPDYPEARTLKDRALYKKALRLAKKGDENLQRKELEKALVSFVQSEQTLPGFLPAKEGIQAVKEALERLSKRAQDEFLEAVRKLPEYRFVEVLWHADRVKGNDPTRDDAVLLRKQSLREIALRTFAKARECEEEGKFGAALLEYRSAQGLDPTLPGVAEEVAQMEREVQAGILVEKAQKDMRTGAFARARETLDQAFEMSVITRARISETMIECRRLEGESRYQAARDLEVLGKKSDALAAFEALSKDWPDGFSDEKARIDGLKYDVESAQKEWTEAEAAEGAADLPKALEHYKNSERFYKGMKDGAARIERIQAAIRAAGGGDTTGGNSGTTGSGTTGSGGTSNNGGGNGGD
ncbi:MAG TPA: hypothetical protein VF384_01785 [Planctomycetota bacterium]